MIIAWNGAHCAFAVERSFINPGESVIVTLRHFLAHLMSHWNDTLLDRKIDSAKRSWIKTVTRKN